MNLHLFPYLLQYFKSNYSSVSDSIFLPELSLRIHNLPFHSPFSSYLPGSTEYVCEKHDVRFNEQLHYREQALHNLYPDCLQLHDQDIQENTHFKYVLLEDSGGRSQNGVILLLHGLNEKTWDKYLPWAYKLMQLTGKKVLLFPIAFHMSRVPAAWSDRRLMNVVANTRREYSLAIEHATFANAAISARIQAIPQRFFWSGLQTFYDIIHLLQSIRLGSHPLLSAECKVDLFSYSVGAFLSEILLMANVEHLFSNAKLFIFCGGPTLDRMSPNSKFILDSDATIALYSYYTERLDAEMKLDPRIFHHFTEGHAAGVYFRSMLNYHKGKAVREQRFKDLHTQIQAVSLLKDEVIPPYEVANTLQGISRNIPIDNTVMDFDFPYDHINPFSPDKALAEKVTKEFNSVFEKAAGFLE